MVEDLEQVLPMSWKPRSWMNWMILIHRNGWFARNQPMHTPYHPDPVTPAERRQPKSPQQRRGV
jgi:hypothetical protein